MHAEYERTGADEHVVAVVLLGVDVRAGDSVVREEAEPVAIRAVGEPRRLDRRVAQVDGAPSRWSGGGGREEVRLVAVLLVLVVMVVVVMVDDVLLLVVLVPPGDEHLRGEVRNLDRGGRDDERRERAVLHVAKQRALELLALALRVPTAGPRRPDAVPQVLEETAVRVPVRGVVGVVPDERRVGVVRGRHRRLHPPRVKRRRVRVVARVRIVALRRFTLRQPLRDVNIVDFFFDGRAATAVGTTTLPPLPPPLPPLLPSPRSAAEVLRPDRLDALRLPLEATVPPRGVRPPGSFVAAAWWNWVREPLETPCVDPSPEPPTLPPLLAPLSRGARLSMARARSSFLRSRTAVHVLFLPLKASTPCRT